MRQFQQKTIAMLLTVFFLLSASLPGVASAEQIASAPDSSETADSSAPAMTEPVNQNTGGTEVSEDARYVGEEDAATSENEDKVQETLEEEKVPLAGGTKGGAKGSTSMLSTISNAVSKSLNDRNVVSEDSQTYSYEDDNVKVTATAPSDALPGGVGIYAQELKLFTYAERESMGVSVTDELEAQYYDACSTLKQELNSKKQHYEDAKVYDISFKDEKGNEYEPTSAVSVSIKYKYKLVLDETKENGANIEIAHIKDNDEVEFVDAKVKTDKMDRVKQTDFDTDSFSLFVVFSNAGGRDTGTGQAPLIFQTGEVGYIQVDSNGGAPEQLYFSKEKRNSIIIQLNIKVLNTDKETDFANANSQLNASTSTYFSKIASVEYINNNTGIKLGVPVFRKIDSENQAYEVVGSGLIKAKWQNQTFSEVFKNGSIKSIYANSDFNQKDFNGINVINIYVKPTTTVPKTEVTVNKIWVDDNDSNGKRPEHIDVQLYNGTQLVRSEQVKQSDGWSYTFTGLDEVDSNGNTIPYTVQETPVTGYDAPIIEAVDGQENSYNITNKLIVDTDATKEITIQKVWEDSGYKNQRPENISVNVKADGTPVGDPIQLSSSDATPTDEDVWEKTIELPKYNTETVREITYTIDEVNNASSANYLTEIDGYTITNTYYDASARTSVSGVKVWAGDDLYPELRPSSITIVLYADGVQKDTKIVTANSNWQYEFNDLPVFNTTTRKKISYTINEVENEKYQKKIGIDGTTITNTLKKEYMTGVDYIARYYHADGTYEDMTGKLTHSGQVVGVNADGKCKSNEVYAGMTVNAGYDIIDINETNGTAVVKNNADLDHTHLVKVNYYYKEKTTIEEIPPQLGGRDGASIKNSSNGFDTKNNKYENHVKGLYTEKTVVAVDEETGEAVSESASGNTSTRTFDLTLESWRINENKPDVGLILDSSGSMAWPSGNPEIISKSSINEWAEVIPNWNRGTGYSNKLTLDQVNSILDPKMTDNSKLSYSGYKYFVFHDNRDNMGVSENVALGYRDSMYNPSWNVYNIESGANAVGWYYMNSNHPNDLANKMTAKQPIPLPNSYSGPTEFWIDRLTWSMLTDDEKNNGYYIKNSNNDYVKDKNGSDVYVLMCKHYFHSAQDYPVREKHDSELLKMEALQHSVAKFSAELNTLSPESKLSLVKFSHYTYEGSQLILQGWTNNTADSIAALNPDNSGGMGTYIITGGTNSYVGIEAYTNNLHSQISDNDQKYLIIFTDGKESNAERAEKAKTDINNLKRNHPEYTVITVFMRSTGMPDSDVKSSRQFLTSLATTRIVNSQPTQVQSTAETNFYYYEASGDNPDELVLQFKKIVAELTKPLSGYTVRDYIDPRFDLLDNDGSILTRLNDDGSFTEKTLTTSNGKTCTVKYDSTKQMFYVVWADQTIPTNNVDAAKLNVWSSTIRVRAKSDFIGGNDILTNGNVSGQNEVFFPDSNGNPTTGDTKHPYKDFPKTTANPAIDIDVDNYEDTVFLGETIDPGSLLSYLTSDADTNLALEYLKRLARKENKAEDYYINQLKSGQELSVDYCYLEKDYNVTTDHSYAGDTAHQSDKIGTLTYKWELVSAGGHTLTRTNDVADPFKSFTTDNPTNDSNPNANDAMYRLVVTYNPTSESDRKSLTRNLANGSTLIHPDAAGKEQTVVSDTGLAVIHVVDGEICVTKVVTNDALSYLSTHDATFTFKLTSNSGQEYTQVLNVTHGTHTADVGTVKFEDLPKGEYTLTEDDASPFGMKTIEVVNATGSDAKREATSASNTMSATWKIGIQSRANSRFISETEYYDSDFSDTAVADGKKEVDPAIAANIDNTGKNYLAAQLGIACVKNELKTIDFSIKKIGVKTFTDFQGTSLSGVTFKLYKANVDGSNWTKMIPEEVIAQDTTNNDGVCTFSHVPDGTYLLEETNTPDGYLSHEPWKVEVSGGTVALLDYASSRNEDGSAEKPFILQNQELYDLPSAGGSGTYLFTIIGVAIGTTAILLLSGDKRKVLWHKLEENE